MWNHSQEYRKEEVIKILFEHARHTAWHDIPKYLNHDKWLPVLLNN